MQWRVVSAAARLEEAPEGATGHGKSWENHQRGEGHRPRDQSANHGRLFLRSCAIVTELIG
jgi:hypothetical protein